MAADKHVYMAWHYAPCIDIQPFLFLAVLPALYQFIFVFISCKYIYPVYGCKADEIHSLIVPEFILTAHERKVQFLWVLFLLAQASACALDSYYVMKW